MGYTHYLTRKQTLPVREFALFTDDCKRIVLQAVMDGIKLCREFDKPDTDPEITLKHVALNGQGSEGHETIYIPRVYKRESWDFNPEDGMFFSFCKTARKPYDAVCVAIFTAAKYRFGDEVILASDGGYSERTEGRQLFMRSVRADNCPVWDCDADLDNGEEEEADHTGLTSRERTIDDQLIEEQKYTILGWYLGVARQFETKYEDGMIVDNQINGGDLVDSFSQLIKDVEGLGR